MRQGPTNVFTIDLFPLVFLLCPPASWVKAFPQDTVAAAAKSLQAWPTLCDPIDGSPPGSSIPGILQARILEWVAISFSNAWKWKVKVKSLSRVRLLVTPWTAAHQAPPSLGFSRHEYWNGVPLPLLALPFSLHAFLLFHSRLVYKWKTCNDITTALVFGLNSNSLWSKPQGFQSWRLRPLSSLFFLLGSPVLLMVSHT